MPRFADIALAIPSQGPFQYLIPEGLHDRLELGKRVAVRLRNHLAVGYVVGFSDVPAVADAKPIDGVIDEHPVLDPAMLALTRWMSDYYACSWGQAIEAALPAPFKRGKFHMKSRERKGTLKPRVLNPEDLPLTHGQQMVYDRVLSNIRSRTSQIFLLHILGYSTVCFLLHCHYASLFLSSKRFPTPTIFTASR